jgi:hypothetical protein
MRARATVEPESATPIKESNSGGWDFFSGKMQTETTNGTSHASTA